LSTDQYNNSSSRWLSTKSEGETKEEVTEEEPQKEEEATQEEASSSDAEAPSPELSKEEALEVQVKELKDQLLRSLAEQDNTRRIAQRDVEQARQFAIKSFAKSLLETSDNLERALGSVPQALEKDHDAHPVLHNLYEGIELTERGLMKAFEANGLEKFGKPGEPFDPNRHDALFEYADPDFEPGTIGQVMKSGFMLNKRVLRPAEVGVVKKSEE
jgi:molecular chaperone GrpE